MSMKVTIAAQNPLMPESRTASLPAPAPAKATCSDEYRSLLK